MHTANTHAGLAALSICEALLLAINERKLLPTDEIVGVLRDAAETHRNAMGTEPDTQDHQEAADLIHAIIAGGYSIQGP